MSDQQQDTTFYHDETLEEISSLKNPLSLQNNESSKFSFLKESDETFFYENVASTEIDAHKNGGIGASDSNSSGGNKKSSSLPSEPLTWYEARTRMMNALELYMEQTSPNSTNRATSDENEEIDEQQLETSIPGRNKYLVWLSSHHIDFYCGSLLFSVALFITSIYFFVTHEGESQDEENGINDNHNDLYRSYTAASTIFLIVSLFNTWLIKNRKHTSSCDVNTRKRRNISSLLHTLHELNEASNKNEASTDNNNLQQQQRSGESNFHDTDNDGDDIIRNSKLQLPGNTLTDIYSVYRLSNNSGERLKGQWYKIPSLLLVQGDFIALQAGDIAPADCKIVNSSRFGYLSPNNHISNTNKKGEQNIISRDVAIVKSGERIKPPPKSKNDQSRNNLQSSIPWFPPGKSSLPENSRKLIHLAGNTRVFKVLETPINKFLYSETRSSQSPQIHRKLWEVRNAMFLLSLIMFTTTLVILLIRFGSNNINIRRYYYLPLLAALSVLPVGTPFVLFLQEIIGTSRILQAVHPFSNRIIHDGQDEKSGDDTIMDFKQSRLFFQYFKQGLRSRFTFRRSSCMRAKKYQAQDKHMLLDFPSLSTCLFEKLGVVTALAIIDDELVCDPISKPEQLLIPSSHGLKLLDLYPKYDEVMDDDDDEDDYNGSSGRSRLIQRSSYDTDSDGEDDNEVAQPRRRRKPLILLSKRYRRKSSHPLSPKKSFSAGDNHDTEVQFEDPSWWRYLPSLKCIGLACLIMEDNEKEKQFLYNIVSNNQLSSKTAVVAQTDRKKTKDTRFRYFHGQAESALINHVCQLYSRNHLTLLSNSIGFEQGDISTFEEMRRIHVVATRVLKQRVQLDRHAIGLQESRNWGLLRPNATSTLIKDSRSGAYQLLTLGDARVVTDFCTQSWQGNISTITPLDPADRREILDNDRHWRLSDLDVTAFSYAPIPCSLEQKLGKKSQTYLVDNRSTSEVTAIVQNKDAVFDDWSLLKNQMFLGLLGSSVSPRTNIAETIEDCDNAGVRFVYFSPRNMRRTKELATKMGIDVAWNCAISLRPLDEGEEIDEHRMISNYGDFYVNARLPHGVDAVIRHLKDVDNVPLLVRLYTDVTKTSTAEMINIFREYGDTTLSIGLSHISSNNRIFISSGLGIGVDILLQEEESNIGERSGVRDTFKKSYGDFACDLSPEEVRIVSSLSSNACVFNISLCNGGIAHVSEFIAEGRAALNAATSAGGFMIVAYISYSLLILLSPCTASTSIPLIPGVGTALHLFIVVPIIAIGMGFTKSDEEAMTIVPIKNESAVTFDEDERLRLFLYSLLKALLPAALSQVMYLISIGSLLIEFDSLFLLEKCNLSYIDQERHTAWVHVIRCSALNAYSGPAATQAGCLVVALHMLCIIALSATFLFGSTPIYNKPIPLTKNTVWVGTSLFSTSILLVYLSLTLEIDALKSLPWYFYLLSLISPFLCVGACELIKKKEKKYDSKAAKMRRLQFETRLGMWSPK